MNASDRPYLICGLGSIGRRHLRNLQALGQTNLVLYRTGKSTLPEEELDGLPVEFDLEEALEKWQPAAAIVANPTSLHLPTAILAARAGCHLLLEKPISDSLDGVPALVDLVAENQLQVLVGFQFRFHPGLQTVRQLLSEDQIGQILSARVHWGEYLPGWHPWEDYRKSYSARADLGGGVILTLCHPYDYLRWFFGEASSVMAVIGRDDPLELEVESHVESILNFEHGPMVSVHLNYDQRPPRHDLEIVGSQGTLRWDNDSGAVRLWTASTESWVEFPPPQGFERNHLFMSEMEHFVSLVNGKGPSRCSLDDGVRALQIALAVREAGQNGRAIAIEPHAAL
jgi:predicted dehydrogenase